MYFVMISILLATSHTDLELYGFEVDCIMKDVNLGKTQSPVSPQQR